MLCSADDSIPGKAANVNLSLILWRSSGAESQARRRSGLEDFGDNSFRPGLERLTTELQEHANLSQIGRVAAYSNLLENLCVRLQLTDYRAGRSEIARQQIQRPLFITGLP